MLRWRLTASYLTLSFAMAAYSLIQLGLFPIRDTGELSVLILWLLGVPWSYGLAALTGATAPGGSLTLPIACILAGLLLNAWLLYRLDRWLNRLRNARGSGERTV